MTHPSDQSQSIGKISIGGNVSGSNLFNFNQNQATGNARINQTQSSDTIPSSELQAALAAVQQLKQEIQTATALNPVQKTMVQAPTEMLETELQKPEPDKNLIEQTIEALKQGLQGVETLAEPVMRVAALVAKAMIL
jgi:tellurite resistance protein